LSSDHFSLYFLKGIGYYALEVEVGGGDEQVRTPRKVRKREAEKFSQGQ